MRALMAALLATATIALAACGGGSEPPEVLAGRFVYPAISGLEYTSDVRAGHTDGDGAFDYWKDGAIIFNVGGIFLTPQIAGAPYFGVSALTGTTAYLSEERSLNVLSFLLAVDDDADATNGIKISSAVRGEASPLSISFSQSVADFRKDTKVLDAVSRLSARTAAGRRGLLPIDSVKATWDKVLLAPMAGVWQFVFYGDTANPAVAPNAVMIVRSSLSTASLVVPVVGLGAMTYSGNVDLDGTLRFGCPEPAPSSELDPLYCAYVTGKLQLDGQAKGTWKHPVTGKSGAWAAVRTNAL